MKKFFFLPPEISYSLVAVIIYSFWKLPLYIEIPVLLASSFVLFIFRRGFIPFRDTVKSDGEIFLSPVHGIVQSVRPLDEGPDGVPVNEVRISITVWDEKGLYMPTSGEVSYLKANKGKKISRDAPSETFYGPMDEVAHTDFVLTSKNKARSMMRFIDTVFGQRPTIWLKSGDRGRGGACFGYYPFGGTLIIYLPISSDVLVFENEHTVPGQTVIAALKDQPKVKHVN
jgi:hypothetical protein